MQNRARISRNYLLEALKERGLALEIGLQANPCTCALCRMGTALAGESRAPAN